jgi:uncharacterized protein YodC (DUF2158 family)
MMEEHSPNRLSLKQCIVGKVVSLRSGGPNMTIAAVNGDEIECVWFGKSDQLKAKTFNRETLQPGSSRAIMLLPPCPECDRYAPLDVRIAAKIAKEQVN